MTQGSQIHVRANAPGSRRRCPGCSRHTPGAERSHPALPYRSPVQPDAPSDATERRGDVCGVFLEPPGVASSTPQSSLDRATAPGGPARNALEMIAKLRSSDLRTVRCAATGPAGSGNRDAEADSATGFGGERHLRCHLRISWYCFHVDHITTITKLNLKNRNARAAAVPPRAASLLETEEELACLSGSPRLGFRKVRTSS